MKTSSVSRIEENTLQHIVLFFNKDAAPYVVSKPLHGSQKPVSKSADGVTISIDVIPNFELETVILSYNQLLELITVDK
ncbi:hypothetical protein [Parapedobacter sp. DT-150]|uniref:hypothetical protein n=1 Tax=Parapedobacter sp. DT-150 TaxID=3396162 RepID=UPI003F1AA477